MGERKYLYDIIYNALKQEILEGVYDAGTLLPSERAICDRFRVERTTTRKALELLVSGGLVEKRAGVGTEVIYSRNGKAGTVQNHAQVIGFFISDAKNTKKITEPYYADLFYYLERECNANDYQLIYSTINNEADVLEITQKHLFKAIIFVTKTSPAIISELKQIGIPMMLINEVYEGIPSIYCDHVSGAVLSMEHLIEMGHERIGIITGPVKYLSTEHKLMACYKVIAEHKLEVPPANIAEGDWTYQSGYEAALKLVCERKPEKRPTAIFAFNDMMAVGAIRAMRNFSISVPEEVSIIGFDNMEQLKFSEPNLTTIDGNTAYLSKMVVESIVKPSLSIYEQGVRMVVPVTLIKRETVRRREN